MELNSESEKDMIRKLFSDWQLNAIKSHQFWAKDSCNGAYYEKYGLQRIKKNDNGWGFPDSSEVKFSFADINNDQHIDGLITFNPTQCDCGNGSMWIQFQILIISNKDKYDIIEYHDTYNINGEFGEGFIWLDSIAPNKLLGTYFQFKEEDGRCCPSIEKRIVIYYNTKEIKAIDKPIPGCLLPGDSITAKNYYQCLVGNYLKMDSLRNPFICSNNSLINNSCDSLNDIKKHYNCVIRNFSRVKLPIEIGPKPDPSELKLQTINDSIFIAYSLCDTEYFETTTGDRTERYGNGYIVDTNPVYDLCLIPYITSCGYDYILCSISKNGELIDKISIGGFWNDISETYGIIKKIDQFEVYTNDFVFRKNGKLFLVNNMHFKYRITKAGIFKIE